MTSSEISWGCLETLLAVLGLWVPLVPASATALDSVEFCAAKACKAERLGPEMAEPVGALEKSGYGPDSPRQ